MQPSARSTSSVGQRADWLKATWVGMPAGPARKNVVHLFVVDGGDIPLRDRVGQRWRMHGRHVGVQQAAAREFAKDRHDPAGAMHVFDVVLRRVRRDLAQLRHAPRQRDRCRPCRSRPRLPARRPAGAGWCWSNRPSRCPGSSRSRTPRTWRCRAARRWRLPRRTSDGRAPPRCGPPAGTVARDRNGWPPRCRCPAATGPALRSGSSSNWR